VMGLPAEKITAVSGILLDDPRTLTGGSGFAFLKLGECGSTGGLRASARGNIPVIFPSESIPRLKEFGRGAGIFMNGNLSAGNSTGNPAGNSANSRRLVFNAESVHIVRNAPALEQWRTGLRMTLLEKFQSREAGGIISPYETMIADGGATGESRNVPVWGSLASALLLGVRDDLNVDLSDGFRNSGCAHILALSGMHLAIFSGVLAFLFRKPLGKRWAALLGVVFVVFYVFVAGSQPSLVRAAIMYMISVIALWGFLKGSRLSFLCLAFILQLLFQSDTGVTVSFILSYLALAGILSLGEPLRDLLRGRIPKIIAGSFSTSLGAFIATAPVVIFYFGPLRPIGIIAGLIVIPIVTLFILLSMAALAASFIPIPLFSVLNFLLTLIYRLLEFIVSQAGRIPGMNFSGPIPVLIFALVFWIIILLAHKQDISYRNRISAFE
ncbi:MAG: ComEC/Rec2 family competence protein, partial [Treponema sp.]|nr:ComEC/Rec2 family competence protein [Treponema sp.]